MTGPAVPPADDGSGDTARGGGPGRAIGLGHDGTVPLESVILAEIQLCHPDLLLAETIRAAPAATARLESTAGAAPAGPVAFLTVAAGSYDRFEEALLADHTVADPRFVAEFAEQRVYHVVAATDLELVPASCISLGARPLAVRTGGDGWVVRLRLFARDALDALRGYCGDNGIEYRVRELSRAESRSEEYAFGLTGSQRTTLLLAAELGYFDVPRRVSQDDLASRLGISTSAVSQRIRRATARLVRGTLSAGDLADD